MNVAAGPTLAAAVTNAGGLGVIGGLGYTPKVLRQQVCLLLLSPPCFVPHPSSVLCINSSTLIRGMSLPLNSNS